MRPGPSCPLFKLFSESHRFNSIRHFSPKLRIPVSSLSDIVNTSATSVMLPRQRAFSVRGDRAKLANSMFHCSTSQCTLCFANTGCGRDRLDYAAKETHAVPRRLLDSGYLTMTIARAWFS